MRTTLIFGHISYLLDTDLFLTLIDCLPQGIFGRAFSPSIPLPRSYQYIGGLFSPDVGLTFSCLAFICSTGVF